MALEYSVDVHNALVEEFRKAALHRPMHVERYEAGTELVYDVAGMSPDSRAQVHLAVEKFVGGGFAGQVYRVKLLDIQSQSGSISGLDVGGIYAIKILIPPTTFSTLFRNVLYWIGFQGPFQLQVNPLAIRAGSLWQKFIRQGAKIRFSDEKAVADIYATFVDSTLGSCGELREWVDGRTWRLEVDDHMDSLKKWIKGQDIDVESLGSPEYRAKRDFMHQFVEMLHDMGSYEFARQYEWSTWKSQPNCLKRLETEGSPSAGLVAVDFRAGLALLPFLPMSPGDFKLIVKGIMRGSLVQFDRGDVNKLQAFIEKQNDAFSDMQPMLEGLKESDRIYRDSVPDITHHHFRLFYSCRLWSTIFESAVTGWKIRNLIDGPHEKKLRDHKALALLFFLIGIIPILGRVFRKIWGRPDWRKHYWMILTSPTYLVRAVRAKVAETVIGWHRAGRIDDHHALNTAKRLWWFSCHLPLSIMPIGLHRFLTDWGYAKERMIYLAVRPVRLYFNAGLREQWLRDMVLEGQKKQLLSKDDAEVILSRIDEPFIQKYLKSLAVHICTLPVTQIVSVMLAVIYVLMHPEMPRGQAWGVGIGIIALFQVVPISPGSLVRGLYVLYLVIKERNFKDYNIAVFLGFFKYVGYLAFPIQMTYRYPTLARFMAAHWATEAVHIVPVFGERGALLEHSVFCLFYNWPLTIRRRMNQRAQVRATMAPRYWPIIICSIVGAGILTFIDFAYIGYVGMLPGLKEIWLLILLMPVLCGTVITLSSGGASLGRRILGSAICGVMMGAFYSIASLILGYGQWIGTSGIVINGVWRVFIFVIFSAIGAILMELKLPEPKTG